MESRRPMSCGACITRRAFLAHSAALAAAVPLLEACGDGVIGNPQEVDTDPPGGSISIVVADFPELATIGQPVVVGPRRAAMRTGTSTFLAVSMICTHQGTTTNIVSTEFHCPNHGSQFDSDGDVLLGPATRPLRRLATTYDPDTDTLTVE